MKLFILAFLLLYSLGGASLLCSALCKPGSCSAADQNSCTDCPTNWSYASSVCSLSTGMGYNLVAKSQDLNGGSSDLALLPATGSSICGDYTYYGQSTCSSNLEIKLDSGIITPHFAIQLVFWVFLYDDTTWADTDIISINLGSQTITRGFDTYDGKIMACDTLMQAYFRMQVDFDHINATNTPIDISVSCDATNSDCIWGLKEAILLQKPCHASCTQCSGSLNTQCFSCIASNFLSGNTCSTACLAGYGSVAGTNICILCDSKCITCSENSTYCSSCKTSLPNQSFLHNFSCQETCPSKTYAKIDDHTCASCSSDCLICSNSSVCSSCDTGFGLFNLTCISTCPGKYFMDGNICSLCDAKCQLCLGSSTNCSSCVLSGAEQSYLANTSCVVGCPAGTFPTTNPNVCNKCADECSVCTGSLASECSECSSGNFLSNSTCAAACLSLYGSQSSSSVCVLCDSHCTACAELSDNCSACVTAGTQETFLDSSNVLYKKCIANCPSTTFANAANHLCDGCDTNCSTCGGAATNCFSCKSGDSWLNFVCYTNCPDGYFKDSANCTLCDGLCSTCSNSAVNCSVCSSSGFLLVTSCLASCPDPYYGLSNICYPCNGACLSCTSSSNSTCSSCNTTFTLSGTICDSDCLPGYGISPTPQLCLLCVSPCIQCYLSDTFCTQCISTPTQYYLLTVGPSSTCVTICPNTFYTNLTALACLKCQTGCSICVDDNICTTCENTHYFYNQSCYSPCPVGTFQANSTHCQVCDLYCTSCQSSYDNCTGCQLNGTYRAYLLGNYCYLTCPFNYYGSNGTCSGCHANCYACYGPGANQCTACKANMWLSSTYCASNCATGYGKVSTNFISCMACNSLCARCYQIPSNCSSCRAPNGFLYDDHNVTYPKCVSICPNGTYANNITQVCDECLDGCAICNITVANKSCITCSAGYGFYNGTCYSPCPDKYYLSGVLCLPCSLSCLECNSSNISCSVCVTSGANKAYLFNQTCIKICPSNYYPIGGGAIPTTCAKCASTCFNCKGNETNCTSCPSGQFLFNSTCLASCPIGYFFSNSTNECEDSTVLLDMSMQFSDLYNSKIIIQLDFTNPLDQATFPLSSFQSINFSDPLLSLSIFKLTYQWLSNTSYTIELQPISYIFLNNIKVTVSTMSKPALGYFAIDSTPFDITTYDLSKYLNWNLVKGTIMSSLQRGMLQTLSSATEKIQSFTTLPGVQQFNKAGFGCMLFPGAQLTTASVLIKTIPSPTSYEGARFWGSFVLFQIPDWEKDKQKQKFVMSPLADNIANNSRLLSQRNMFQIDSIEWRFKRTGFTTIFLLDCYMQIILIVVSWALVFIARRLEGKVRATIISKFYSAFHWLHQICIFYLSLGLVLEFMYFDSKSALRVISMVTCLIFNFYYLIYQLYIYYDLIKYPTLQIGTPQYRETAKKYGYFLRHIRYEQYDITEQWNPSHFFRPYNYHIASFYKKYLMIVAVPLFYNFPHYAAGSLVVIQLFQIIRFSISWPFASKRRNIIRICLEFIILTFFITLVLQVVYMDQISKNNIETIVGATDIFSLLGWIGFCCIFIFNISFVIFFIHDICCYLTTSNSSEMRSIRKDFYYQKILRYQNCIDEYADNQMLDSWVVKGDLNDHWLDDKQEIEPDIEITVERLTINKMGDLFQLEIEKIAVLQMKHMSREVTKQRLKIREQISGTISVKKEINSTLFGILKDLFESYDPKYQADYINIKTVAKINPKKYKIGTQIRLQQETHFQILTIKYPWAQKKVKRLPNPERGFPLSIQLFNSYIYDKMLNKKYLY